MSQESITGIEVAGFADHHTHLLKAAAGMPMPWQGTTVRDFHLRVQREGTTPMDIADPPSPHPPGELAEHLRAGLAMAARAGLVEVTEMGMRDWSYLDALSAAAEEPLPARLRIYLASGLAESVSDSELDARRADAGPWISLDGIKFYADGWLVPRTCAVCQDFSDTGDNGLLFTSPPTLARRIERFIAGGWRIATHAIGDLGVQTVLDAYELAWGKDRQAMAAAMPRIEHASMLSGEVMSRMAELGVWACLQPSFAVTDAGHIGPALGAGRAEIAYPWARLITSGVQILAGTDFPIEVIEPLVGVARLVHGRSERTGFTTEDAAPERSRVPVDVAMAMYSDPAAGRTILSADPVSSASIDKIEVSSTKPVPFQR
ncbi:MAG TPA: amidohydrolase family protein [Streptosporangiaceae bacterium]|nr:amidohydrolase family protein [Streptosporangiaceae bacterium]